MMKKESLEIITPYISGLISDHVSKLVGKIKVYYLTRKAECFITQTNTIR